MQGAHSVLSPDAPRTHSCVLGFPRDVTSRDNPGRDIPMSLCTGTKQFPCPTVPLSRDKKSFLVLLSLCPGTRTSEKIQGQCPLSRDVSGQNHCLFSSDHGAVYATFSVLCEIANRSLITTRWQHLTSYKELPLL